MARKKEGLRAPGQGPPCQDVPLNYPKRLATHIVSIGHSDHAPDRYSTKSSTYKSNPLKPNSAFALLWVAQLDLSWDHDQGRDRKRCNRQVPHSVSRGKCLCKRIFRIDHRLRVHRLPFHPLHLSLLLPVQKGEEGSARL